MDFTGSNSYLPTTSIPWDLPQPQPLLHSAQHESLLHSAQHDPTKDKQVWLSYFDGHDADVIRETKATSYSDLLSQCKSDKFYGRDIICYKDLQTKVGKMWEAVKEFRSRRERHSPYASTFTIQGAPSAESYEKMSDIEKKLWSCLYCGGPALADSLKPGRLCSILCSNWRYDS